MTTVLPGPCVCAPVLWVEEAAVQKTHFFSKGHCFIEMTWAELEKGIKVLLPQHLTNSKITESTAQITNYT